MENKPGSGKTYDPLEPVAVTLTREQWRTVLHALDSVACQNNASMVWWSTCCADKRMGAETAAKYARAEKEAQEVHGIIEAAMLE